MKHNDATILFLEKEGKELRGKHNLNFFILVAIFAVAIFSIGFGGASIKYLQHKMDDPFINWIDIIVRQKISDKNSKLPLADFLKDSVMRSEIQFDAPEENYLLNIDFRHQEKGKNIQLQGRSIGSHSSILPKILDESNVITRRGANIKDDELGLIVTQGTLSDLGYKEMPTFIELALSFDDETCHEIKIEGGINGSYPVAFPIIAIVKQLPGMNSFLFTKRFLQDCSADNKTSYDITDEENNHTLIIVDAKSKIEAIAKQINHLGYTTNITRYRETWNDELYAVSIESGNESYEDIMTEYNLLYKNLAKTYSGITRIYDFQPIQSYSLDDPAYYSVQIKNLANIKLFQKRLYEKCGIKLEMTSVDQKNNFQFVQRMGNILSVCIILIAVLFICFFIYFMLSTHFQRIQRNLGTFKAFGISNSSLYYIYVVLLLRITIAAYAIAFAFAWVCNTGLNLITQIELGYKWIDVMVWQNLLLLILAVVAAIIASYLVAKSKLQYTPGDLIYNRNYK